MPSPVLETPPNPALPPQPPPSRIRTGRFGELDEHELVRLLDSLDDESAKARFRESIYISLFICIAIAWFLLYGPRYLLHQPRLINPSEVLKARELTHLTAPADIARQLQHAPQAKPAPRPRMESKLDAKTLEAMRRPAPPQASSRPAIPQPQPPQQTLAPQPTPLPSLPQPQRPAPSVSTAVPDAPRPNFNTPTKSAGDSIREALRGATQNRGGGAESTSGITPSHVGVGTGVDILSDTMGVDFDPYLKKIMRQIYNTWIPLIPEEARPPLNKAGVTQIRFTILPDGRIGGMTLEGSTHDDALNRAAWGSITGVGQFPSLPSDFHGPNLELRIHYLVNQKTE
jgi:outer membrane biosynthesis protein TonB